MLRRRWWLLLVASVLALTGCRLDVDVTTTMAADGSGVVSVRAKPDDELLAKRPELFTELALGDAKAAGWTVEGPSADHVLTLSKPFRTPAEGTRVLRELSGPKGPLRDLALGRADSFARVTSSFDGAVQLDGGLDAFADDALVRAVGRVPLSDLVTVPVEQGLRLTVTVELPGSVTSNGSAPESLAPGATAPGGSGATAPAGRTSWTPSLADGARTTMAATGVLVDREARDARRTSQLAWWGAAAYGAVLVAVGVVGFVGLRRRRS